MFLDAGLYRYHSQLVVEAHSEAHADHRAPIPLCSTKVIQVLKVGEQGGEGAREGGSKGGREQGREGAREGGSKGGKVGYK